MTPPLWFLGVYETLLGTNESILLTLARRGCTGLAAVTVIAVIAYPLAYRRVMADAVEHPEGLGRVRRTARTSRWFDVAIGRNGVVRATAQFFLATIARMERQRLTLAVAGGAALAWTVPTALRWYRVGWSFAPSHARDLLALPLAVMVIFLVDLRIAATVPSDLRAAWIFHTTMPPPQRVRTAVRRVIFVSVVAPIVSLAAAVYWRLWGLKVAMRHTVFLVAVALLGVLSR
jgi:hypothetical protein